MPWVDASSSPLFPGNDLENRMMLHMASPPLDAIPLGPPPMELDHSHIYQPYVNLDRRLRLEQDIHPLMEYARGSFSSYADAKETHGTYHQPLSRVVRKDNAPIGSLYTGEFDYPSPSSLGVASISAGNRSPSPPEAVTSGFTDPYFMAAGSGFARMCWGGGDATEYRSVMPQETLHEPLYPEPITPVDEKVPQTFNPRASFYHPRDETLIDNDNVDADGEPDAMCIEREDSNPILTDQKISAKMPPKTKRGRCESGGSSSSNSRKCAAVAATTAIPKSPIRKRFAVASRKSNQTSTRNTKAHVVKGSTSSSSAATTTEKRYSCSFKQYGCESTFSTKNEWKRHFASQHLKLEYYRCDLKGCDITSKGPNDFNRKDLFTQHLRRMHAPWTGRKTAATAAERADFDKTLDEHALRCSHKPRNPPAKTSCGMCNNLVFEDWSKRMEHMSQHYERDPHFEEARDENLEAWALQAKILCRRDSSSSEVMLADLVHKRR